MSMIGTGGVRDAAILKHVRIDAILEHRMVIGYRRWAMAQLYYRAGLTQQEIGDIFGITRQMVSHELNEAFREVSAYLAEEREKARPPRGNSN